MAETNGRTDAGRQAPVTRSRVRVSGPGRGPTSSTITRARSDVAADIERMMRAGEWVRGESAELLARTSGYAVSSVGAIATEVSRRLRSAMSDEDMRAEIIARLDELSERALDDGQFSAAIAALKTMLEARGLIERGTTVNVNVNTAPLPVKVSALLAHPELGPALRAAVRAELAGEVETTGEGR